MYFTQYHSYEVTINNFLLKLCNTNYVLQFYMYDVFDILINSKDYFTPLLLKQ